MAGRRVSTALTLAVGLLPAYVLARYRFAGRSLVLALVTVPFVLPTVVVGAAFLALLPTSLDQTVWAILIAHVFFNLAVVIRTVGTLWGQLDPRVEEAARTLGASPRQVMLRGHAAAPAPRAPGRGVDHVPVHLHLVRGRPAPRWAPPPDASRSRSGASPRRRFELRAAAALAFLQLVAVTGLMLWWSNVQSRQAVTLRLRPRGTATPPRTARQRALVASTVGGLVAIVVIPLGRLVAALAPER